MWTGGLLHLANHLFCFCFKCYLFIFGCAGSSLLCGFSLVAALGGLFFVAVWTSHCLAFLVAEHGPSVACAWVVAARGLSNCSSRALEHRLSSCDAGA